MRVAVVTTEPTPSRVPQFDRLARRPQLDLHVFYAAPTIQRRTWSLKIDHPHTILGGPRLPLNRILFHDYPVTPSIWRELERGDFDVVVVWGWSVFASQLAVVWARWRRIPYVVFSESQLAEPRNVLVRLLKRLVVPRVLHSAAGYLVTGSRAREHLVHYGADPTRIRRFANTIDIAALGADVKSARTRQRGIRERFGFAANDVVVLHAGRLIPLKGVDVLAEAVAQAGEPFRLLVAGDGPERRRLERTVPSAVFAGFLQGRELVEAYAAADVFALLSLKETWGVVVVEAAAAGLPLVVSQRVGAGADLVAPGLNGELVPPNDVSATAAALRSLASAEVRQRYGLTSVRIAAEWSYGPSEEAFEKTVIAARSRPRTSRGVGR